MPKFVNGLDLARSFYLEAVRPLVDRPHAACLIGEGSEILGYDTERSTDHEWGPRLQLFLAADDVDRISTRVHDNLPQSHGGYPTAWYSLTQGRVADHVEITTIAGWLAARLPTIPTVHVDSAAWLATPQQHLLQLTGGSVFHDDRGELTELRRSFDWYPPDVWRWVIAAQWHLIGNAGPVLGRTVELGDTRGARLLVGRLCDLIMEMAFLQERRYRPYAKWFGRAFADLDAASTLGPLVDHALANQPTGRADDAISQALLVLGQRHNDLGLTEPVRPALQPFTVGINDAVRPYLVLNSADFIDATVGSITDPGLRDLPRVGSIDQLTHADDLLVNFTGWPAALATTYRDGLRGANA